MLLLVAMVLAIPLWLPPVVIAVRSKQLSAGAQAGAIVLAVVSPLVAVRCFSIVSGYCSAGIGPPSGFGEGALWPNCPSAEAAWLAVLAPATLVGIAAWILALGGFVPFVVALAVVGGMAAVSVNVSSSARTEALLERQQEQRDRTMAEFAQERLEAEAEAEAVCVELPGFLRQEILAGLSGWMPGAWMGRPGTRLVVDNVYLYGISTGDDTHHAVVKWSVPAWPESTQFSVNLLVSGSLEQPDAIHWRLLGLGGGAAHNYPNPLFFEPVEYLEDIGAPWLGCEGTGRGLGPYRTWELGGCADSVDPWCTSPETNTIWDPDAPLPPNVDEGLEWEVEIGPALNRDLTRSVIRLTRDELAGSLTWTWRDDMLLDHEGDVAWVYRHREPEVVAQQATMDCTELEDELEHWREFAERTTYIRAIHAYAFAQNALNLMAVHGCPRL